MDYDFDIQSVETAILDRLKATHPRQSVEPFPEGAGDYVLKNKDGAILVVYNSSSFGRPGSIDYTSQRADNLFQVAIVTKDLRGHAGSYTLIKSVIKALAGHRHGIYGFFPRRVDFDSRLANQWQYNLLFQIDTHFENEPT